MKYEEGVIYYVSSIMYYNSAIMDYINDFANGQIFLLDLFYLRYQRDLYRIYNFLRTECAILVF